MRNLTDEQAIYIATEIVREHLDSGVEYLDITEITNGVFEDDDEDATDEDYTAVASSVDMILRRLASELGEN